MGSIRATVVLASTVIRSKAKRIRLFIYTSRNPSNPKDWCQDSWGPNKFPAPKSPREKIITYLNRVFDTTRGSKFWVLKFLFLGQFSIFSY